MNKQEWLQSLKVGDEVAVYGYMADQNRVDKVLAVHKLHVVVNKTKYRRDDGWAAGRGLGYTSTRIEPVTPEFVHRIAVMRARSLLRYLNPDKFSDESLLRIADVVRKEIKDSAEKPE